jgi:hypothetical protein
MVFDPVNKILGYRRRVHGDYFSRNAISNVFTEASKQPQSVMPTAGKNIGEIGKFIGVIGMKSFSPNRPLPSPSIPGTVLTYRPAYIDSSGSMKSFSPNRPLPSPSIPGTVLAYRPAYIDSSGKEISSASWISKNPSTLGQMVYRNDQGKIVPVTTEKPLQPIKPIDLGELQRRVMEDERRYRETHPGGLLPKPIPVPLPPWRPQPPEKRPWPSPQPPRYGGLYPGDRPGAGGIGGLYPGDSPGGRRIVPLTGSEVFGGGNMAEFPRPTRMLESLQARSPTVFRTQKPQRLPEEII